MNMLVTAYLKVFKEVGAQGDTFTTEEALAMLNQQLGIRSKIYPEGLIVLNYDQIESPKTNPIVM